MAWASINDADRLFLIEPISRIRWPPGFKSSTDSSINRATMSSPPGPPSRAVRGS